MMQNKRRPVFLDLTRIDLPITAVISIIHRLTGVLFFVLIPFLIYLFDLSLSGQQGFEATSNLLDHWLARALLVLLSWGFAHHLLAGIRYLLIDIDIGVGLESSRVSAWCVVGGGLIVLFTAALTVL
jgi:succinate dehydrogenase / fumarate reductase cytochrome b subunit